MEKRTWSTAIETWQLFSDEDQSIPRHMITTYRRETEGQSPERKKIRLSRLEAGNDKDTKDNEWVW
jgi:hypothetical protein